MGGIAIRGLEVAAAAAGGKAVRSAMRGRYRKALYWSIPVVVAGAIVWYLRGS
jgi:hypothetical protein